MSLKEPFLGPRLSSSIVCDIPMKRLGSITSIDQVIEQELFEGGDPGFSFTTKVLKTESFFSNLSHPESLGLDYYRDEDDYDDTSSEFNFKEDSDEDSYCIPTHRCLIGNK